MKIETHVDRELKQALEAASQELHALTILEGHELADSPGGADEIWIDLRRREFGLTPTLAHILTDVHLLHTDLPPRPRM